MTILMCVDHFHHSLGYYHKDPSTWTCFFFSHFSQISFAWWRLHHDSVYQNLRNLRKKTGPCRRILMVENFEISLSLETFGKEVKNRTTHNGEKIQIVNFEKKLLEIFEYTCLHWTCPYRPVCWEVVCKWVDKGTSCDSINRIVWVCSHFCQILISKAHTGRQNSQNSGLFCSRFLK